jgi:hypothetical protein
MTSANGFMPLFDPVVDTFETLRQRSRFCFTVILAITLRVSHRSTNPDDLFNLCWEEAHNLAAKSLFMGSPELETVQGMVLLAAYSEKNWFAIKHARQLGQDLGLDQFLPQLLDQLQQHQNAREKHLKRRYLAQGIRTWLILHYVEQEVVDGTARQSRVPPIQEQLLRSFINIPASTSSDIRIASTIEVVQLRGTVSAHSIHPTSRTESNIDRSAAPRNRSTPKHIRNCRGKD